MRCGGQKKLAHKTNSGCRFLKGEFFKIDQISQFNSADAFLA